METLFLRIWGESIKFASHLKKNNYLQEKQLLKVKNRVPFCQLKYKNCTEEMIQKLHLSDGSEIKDQKKILLEVQTFYSQLLKVKDKDVYDTRSFEYINFQSLKKISNSNLGNPITVDEVGNVLKKIKIINHQELMESQLSSGKFFGIN